MKPAKDVQEYISTAPVALQPKLRAVRVAIREVASDADESVSYGMAFYSYKGETGIDRRLCYFGLVKGGIGFYLRPKDLETHEKQVGKYKRTKSALLFPVDKPVPVSLIKDLVQDAIRRHEAGSRGSRPKRKSRSV